MAVKVVFNEVDEFLEELGRDGALERIDEDIVRVTGVQKTSKFSPNIKNLFIKSTYRANGTVVELSRFLGDLWSLHEKQDKKVVDKYNEYMAIIRKYCEDHKLDCRSGAFEVVGDEVQV